MKTACMVNSQGFSGLVSVVVFFTVTMGGFMEAAEIRLTPASGVPGFSFLSWDTEGNAQTKLNLLQDGAGATFQVETNGKWVDGRPFVVGTNAAEGSLDLGSAGRAELRWSARTKGAGMVWSLANLGGTGTLSRIRITLPFNPRMAATTVLPSRWLPPDGFALPAMLSAADFGQLLVRQQGGPAVTGRFTGDRHGKRIDVTFEFAAPKAGETVTLDFSPWQLPTPKCVDEATWKSVRRGWWNVFEPCVRGHLGIGVVPAPAGVFANNPISDPVSSLYVFIADHALLIPELAPGISSEYLLRFSAEWWLDHHINAAGAIEGYENHYDMLDAPSSILIASWACTEMSDDLTWAQARIGQLERIADFLATRDVDHDGIIESPHSGNANTLCRREDRGATSWDTINSGHKELYINTLAYRAFCCLADLEKRLQRTDKAARYADLAGKLKAAFFQTFHSPQTGLLSWWISADGQRHDYWAPGIQGLPISYGLVPPDEGRRILAAVRGKVMETGFSRLDLGLPCVLTPIRRADCNIAVGAEYGCPSREDGSDTFGRYLNGGCLVSDQIHWLNAHFRLGQGEAVQPQLAAMLARQAKPVFPNGGSFQNGIVNVPTQGAEFYDWSGNTTGYEGHLVYSWFFLQAVLTRQPEYLSRLYRPMNQTPPTRPEGLEPLGRLP